MRFRWVCLTLCASQFLGCENPRPVLTRVEPVLAYSDATIALTLVGDGFIPATALDPRSGRRVAIADGFHARIGKDDVWAELTNLDWVSMGQMTASLPSTSAAGLPSEHLNVELTDPRGQTATLTGAFSELGPDITPPTITFASPAEGTPVGPGSLLNVVIRAWDTQPGTLASLSWRYVEPGTTTDPTNCPVASLSAETDCIFQISVSKTLSGGETIQIVADATDASAAENHTPATLSFTVRARATVASISPSSGGTAGGTDVVITGSGFLAGSQAILDGVPLFPEGGIRIDDNTLSGHVPAHDAGATAILVSTPLGEAIGRLVFTYLPPPLLETIQPNSGSAAGGTTVTLTGRNFTGDTLIYFGSSLDRAVPLDALSRTSAGTIIGRTPMGSGQTTVWAFDEALGFTGIPNGFTWRTP